MNSSRVFSPKGYDSLIQWVIENGDQVNSERGMTTEILGANLRLNDPINRVDPSKSRKMNLAFAFAEWISLMTGEQSISYFTNFIKDYKKYSTDGVYLDGAYGARIAEFIPNLVEKLNSNNSTRRAVISIYENDDLRGLGGLNTPCTLTYQFLVRDNKLHMFANMRSNDLHFGLTNDVVVNTMLQEWVALSVGVEMGSYFHNAASLHVYHDIHEKIKYDPMEGRWPHLMSKMDPTMTSHGELDALRGIYSTIDAPYPGLELAVSALSSQYAKDMANVGISFANRSNEFGKKSYDQISDITMKRIARMWLKKEPKDGK